MKRPSPSLMVARLLAGAGLLLPGLVPSPVGAASTPALSVSFERDIAPILAAKCVACHGPEKSKGGYRLDTYHFLLQDGDSDVAPIVAGDAKASLLYDLLSTSDPDDRMPQEDDPLSPDQLALFHRWIEQGAPAPPAQHDLPVGVLAARTQHPAPPPAYPVPQPVLAVAFLPKEGHLVTGGFHEICLWNTGPGRLLRRWTNLVERIHDLSPAAQQGLLLVVGGNPGRLGEARLLDTSDGTCRSLLDRAADSILAGAFSPDGTRVAVVGHDQGVRLYQTREASLLHSIDIHSDAVLDVAFSPSGRRLATASRDGTARVFDVETASLLSTYREHDGAVTSVLFGREETTVLSASGRRIHTWKSDSAKRMARSKPLAAPVQRMVRHEDQLWVGTRQGQLVQLELPKPDQPKVSLQLGDSAISALAISPSGHQLAVGTFSGRVHLVPTSGQEAELTFVASPGWNPPPLR